MTAAGAAAERTALAWMRTAASMAVVGLLMVRAGADSGSGLATSLGAAVVAAGGAVGWLGPEAGAAADPRRMAATAVALAFASAAVLAVILLT